MCVSRSYQIKKVHSKGVRVRTHFHRKRIHFSREYDGFCTILQDDVELYRNDVYVCVCLLLHFAPLFLSLSISLSFFLFFSCLFFPFRIVHTQAFFIKLYVTLALNISMEKWKTIASINGCSNFMYLFFVLFSCLWSFRGRCRCVHL